MAYSKNSVSDIETTIETWSSQNLSGSSQDHQDFDPHSGVKRGLKTRHLSMMALAGIIGPGLLVGAGGALASGGPAALLIGFGVIGIIAFSIMQSLGEITTLYPTGGAFTKLGQRFVDKAFAFAIGWNYFIIWIAVLSNEYNTLSSIMDFWSDKVPIWGYFLLFWSAFLGFQLLGVTAFGESEFWLALMKLLGLVAYFIFSIIYAAGGLKGQEHAIGFQYWHNPGAFSHRLSVAWPVCLFSAQLSTPAVNLLLLRQPKPKTQRRRCRMPLDRSFGGSSLSTWVQHFSLASQCHPMPMVSLAARRARSSRP